MSDKIKSIALISDEMIAALESNIGQVEQYDDPTQLTSQELEEVDVLIIGQIGPSIADALISAIQRDLSGTQPIYSTHETPLGARGRRLETTQSLLDLIPVLGESSDISELVENTLLYLVDSVGVGGASLHRIGKGRGGSLIRASKMSPKVLQSLSAHYSKLVLGDEKLWSEEILELDLLSSNTGSIGSFSAVQVRFKEDLFAVLTVTRGGVDDLEDDVLKTVARQLALLWKLLQISLQSREKSATLQRAAQQASHSEKFATVGVLAAGIAHELNNPASYVITNLTVLHEQSNRLLSLLNEHSDILQKGEGLSRFQEELDELREEIPEMISDSLQGMHRIRDIVSHLHGFSHKESGEGEWLDINQVLGQILRMASGELRKRARVELDLRELPHVHLESTRLQQVLLNLVVNAYQSFGELQRGDKFLRLSTILKEDEVQLSIMDNGSGIPEKDQKHIFEPFFTTKTVGDGSGLGLAITYDLIKAMGGTIRFKSVVGRGTNFTVVLPLYSKRYQNGIKWRPVG
jgi:signal transduction histidine kinase